MLSWQKYKHPHQIKDLILTTQPKVLGFTKLGILVLPNKTSFLAN